MRIQFKRPKRSDALARELNRRKAKPYSYAQGGVVQKGGLAKVHTGETIIPAGVMPLLTAPAGPARPDALPPPYITQLPQDKEQQFQSWVKTNQIPFDPSPTADYDMRGFWQAQQAGQAQRAENLHFPDTYKTPYHQSFSDESRYAIPGVAPHWQGNQLIDRTGKVVFKE